MAKIRDPLGNLFEKLLSTKYPEVNLWSIDDFKRIISKSEPPWWDLLKWLLGELDDRIKDMLLSAEREELPVLIKEVLPGLGLVSSLRDLNLVKRIDILTRIIEILEVKTMLYNNGNDISDDDDNKQLDELNFKGFDIEDLQFLKGEQKDRQLSFQSLMHNLNEKESSKNMVEESLCKKRQELGLTDDNVTALDYKKQLLEKRESIMERLVTVETSVNDVFQTVIEINKSELQALLPVETPDLIKIQGLEELSEKIACYYKFLENQYAAEKSMNHLHERFHHFSEKGWSLKNSDSLKVNNLLEQVNSVIRNNEL